MDFLDFQSVSLHPDSGNGLLRENFNSVIGHRICHDTYQVLNTDMLWFVNEIIEDMNCDNLLCGCFCLYPSYVAGILNRMPNIHFYVVCSEKITFDDYIKKYMANKERTIQNVDDTFGIFYHEKVIKIPLDKKSYVEDFYSN
jgi:hypothetical protein